MSGSVLLRAVTGSTQRAFSIEYDVVLLRADMTPENTLAAQGIANRCLYNIEIFTTTKASKLPGRQNRKLADATGCSILLFT